MDDKLLDYALCTDEDVFSVLVQQGQGAPGPEADTVNLVIRLINLFTITIEGGQFCNRKLKIVERTEYFDGGIGVGVSWVRVEAPPFIMDSSDPPEPTIQVWEDGTRAFGASTELTKFDSFYTDDRGFVYRRDCNFSTGIRSIKVTYTGGLVTPMGAGMSSAAPPRDLREACALQVASWWSRRKELSLQSISFPQGGAITLMDPTKLLTIVRQVIQNNRIYR